MTVVVGQDSLCSLERKSLRLPYLHLTHPSLLVMTFSVQWTVHPDEGQDVGGITTLCTLQWTLTAITKAANTLDSILVITCLRKKIQKELPDIQKFERYIELNIRVRYHYLHGSTWSSYLLIN